MPILIMGVFALAIFLIFGGLFFYAMSAEHRQREAAEKAEAEKNSASQPKAVAQSAGR
jgi:Na+-transporting methylmalonyl-CoA/oxaloacetate decarboxylase gamma subunit